MSIDYESLFNRLDEMLDKGVEIVIRKANNPDNFGRVVEVRDAKLHYELYARFGPTTELALISASSQQGEVRG